MTAVLSIPKPDAEIPGLDQIGPFRFKKSGLNWTRAVKNETPDRQGLSSIKNLPNSRTDLKRRDLFTNLQAISEQAYRLPYFTIEPFKIMIFDKNYDF